MPAGRPKGQEKKGGRQKGTPNRRTIAMKTAADLCIQYGIEPLELMFKGMKRPLPTNKDLAQKEIVHDYRLRSATAAAPYVRPKLGQVEVKGPGPGGAHFNFNANVNAEVNLDPNDPATLEKARRVAFLLAQGIQVQKRLAASANPVEKVVNPPKSRV